MPLSTMVVHTSRLRTLVIEIQHDLFQLALAHLAVADGDTRFGNQLRQRASGLLDRIDGVVQEINLTAAADFAEAGLANRRCVPLRDERFDRQSRHRRRRDQRQLAQAAHRHVQRTRNRRRGERQNVHFGAQLFQLLFVFDAEAMLFVDDDQAEPRELHA